MARFVVDADDFCENLNALDLLFQLRAKIPGFKITLFTIIGECSRRFLEEVQDISWIRIAAHGWVHKPCTLLAPDVFRDHMERIEERTVGIRNYTKGFKSPKWRMTPWAYEVLMKHGYWICDHPHWDWGRPANIPTAMGMPGSWKGYHIMHYHISGQTAANGIKKMLFASARIPKTRISGYQVKEKISLIGEHTFHFMHEIAKIGIEPTGEEQLWGLDPSWKGAQDEKGDDTWC